MRRLALVLTTVACLAGLGAPLAAPKTVTAQTGGPPMSATLFTNRITWSANPGTAVVAVVRDATGVRARGMVQANATGVVNLAGDGVVTVRQAASIVGRPVVPLPLPAAGFVGGLARRMGLADFSPDQMSVLAFGRGLDTTRMRSVLDFQPRFTSRGAFEDFARTVGPAVPAAAIVGDAVSGVAGTATQAVLRTLGTGRGN